ncbi:MAG: RimK family alpha-L-glutamate ligase [Lachnospirales bacterium]
MLNGFLVINEFLSSKKFNEIYKWLYDAFEKRNHKLDIFTNAELLGGNLPYRPDFVLFWDKDINLAMELENMGIRLFNSAKAIEVCDNKALTYIALKNKIKMPKTIIAPMTYRNIGYTNFDFLDKINFDYPYVIKECFGSFGQQVYLVNNREECLNILKNTSESLIFQEFIS